MKICTKCGAEKPLDAFNRALSARDGRKPDCRACASAYMRRYNTAARERGSNSQRRTEDPGGWTAYQRAHALVIRARGKASAYTCPCGTPARDWALDRDHPDVIASARYVWAEDAEAYRPRCRSCNLREDFARKRGVTA